MTTKDIEDRLAGPEPCWEKRYAVMLSGWKKKEDLDWEDQRIMYEPTSMKHKREPGWL
jgi:hypothetical protein